MQSSSPGSRKSSAAPARPASSPAKDAARGKPAPLPAPPLADGKHRNQLLAYMVAIQDARAMWQRIVLHRPGPSLHLPQEVQCMDVWAVLHGAVRQQRVWTFGKQREAALPPAAPASDSRPSSRAAADAAPAAAADDARAIRPVVCSREPVSVKEGVLFSSCAAGHQHSAAAAGPFLFTWGSNDAGQCGVEACTQAPEAVHVLAAAATPGGSAAGNSNSSSSTDGAAMPGRQIKKTDSLMALAHTLKLPAPLVGGLAAQKQHNLLQALEQQEQDAALLQEAAQHSSSSSCQQSTAPASCTEAAAGATPGSGTGCMPQPQQHGQHHHLFSRQQQQASCRQPVPVLAVHRLHVGQAVHMVACGAKHTLAALASSGLMAFGLNDTGQCGAPAAMYRVVPAPMRIHGLDGCRLRCVSAGAKHSAAVQENGTLITWGHGKFGRLGVGGCPDSLPPSVVGGLRGCVVTQVACGTAHTLALTSDGRVYAWGFNGQGAVGTGDAHERLVPGLVPGLPPCIQVAAAACSMALSCEQQVYAWGRGQAKWQMSSSSSSSSDGLGKPAAAPAAKREPLPWLSGVRVQQIGCGVETAAVVTSSGRLLMWGQQSCMPGSLLEGATPLADAAAAWQQRSAAVQQRPGAGEQAGGCRDATGDATAGAAGADDVAVAVQLLVTPAGLVHVVLTSNSSSASPGAQQPEPAAAASCPAPDNDSDGDAEAASPGAAGRGVFDPAREPLLGVACGESHSLLLCRASQHTPSAGEVRAAVLAVLQAYIMSYLARPLNNLNALMQQQLAADRQRTEADWEGGSIAASAVSGRRRARYAGSIASFANGSSKAARLAGAAGGAGALPALPSKAGGLRGSSGAGGGVAFAGVAEGSGSDCEGEAGPAGPRGNSGAGGCYAPSMVGGSRYAASVVSRRQASGARSVMGVSASADRAGDSEAAAAAAAAAAPAGGPDELDIHGVLLLCRELNLIDNITEHADVMRVFELCLHRKRGRLGPAGGSEPPAAQPLAAVSAEAAGQSGARPSSRQLGLAAVAAGDQLSLPGGEAATSSGPARASQADTLTIVRVVRPGLPASEAQAAAAAAAAAGGVTNATAAAAAAILAVGRSSSPGPPGSRCGSPGPAAIAAAAPPRVLQVQRLDAGELLELLLTVMKERVEATGSGGRPQSELLLRLLAGLHMSRLQARVHDKGPPWLLHQMLQPELLALVESPATSELLHGIYVHLAGSSGNPQDLSMNLSDLRKGLRHAAGFGPLRGAAARQQQQGSSAAGAKPRPAETGAGRARPFAAAASGSTSASGSGQSFHLPLHKLAAFLRTARLLPRLMEKYVSQQQQLGQEQKQRPGGLIMPALRANASLSRVRGFKKPSAAASGHRRRSVQDLGSSNQQQQQQVAGLSRLGTLQQSPSGMHEQAADGGSSGFLLCDDDGGCSGSRPALDSAGKRSSAADRALKSHTSLSSRQQQWQDSRHALPASPIGAGQACPWPGASFSIAVASAAGDDQVTGLPDLPLRRLAGPGGPGLQAAASSHRLGQTAREQQQQQGAAPAATPARASHAEDWLIAEGGIVDASVLDAVELVAGRSSAASILIDTDTRELGHGLAGGRHRRQSASVRLALQLPAPHALLAQNSGSSGAAAAGASPWPSSSGGAQQPGLTPPAAANAPSKGSSKVTYQQQQAALKQQRQTAEASAQAAAELELIRQDTWTVFVLVELLGSHLVTPAPEACVRLPARLTQQQQAGVGDASDATVLCSWDSGYACGTPGAACASAESTVLPTAGGSVGSVPVDLLHHCITYPQFVEVLLCLLGSRATSLLEPDAKQLQPLSLDSEMLDHAQLVWERIRKWRTRQLTPSAAAPAASRPGTAATAAAPSSSGAAAAGGADALDGIAPVSRVHSLFSSMRRGVLGLQRDCFLQLLAAARITGSSGVTAASAAAVFDGLSKQSKPAAAAAAGSSEALPVSRPVLEQQQRQSTFMRRVTQQLLDSLGTPAGPAATTGLLLDEEEEQQVEQAAASGSCLQQTREMAGDSPGSTTSRRCSSSSSSCDVADSCAGSGSSSSSNGNVRPASSSSCSAADDTSRPGTGTTASSGTATGAGSQPGAPCADHHDAVLTLQQFYAALRLLCKQLFPRIANGDRAWRLLLERHVTPLADKHSSSKFDQFARSLTTPGIVALLTACEQQLSELFDAAVAAQDSKHPQQQRLLQSQGLLLLPSLLELLQEHDTIPQLLQPSDVQEVLRRLMMQRQDLDGVFCGLGPTDFAHALAMCGMAVFAASRRLQQGRAQQPEQQLAAFLQHLGLRAVPVAMAAAGGAHSSERATTDPYKELWSLRFDPAAESRAHDQLSSLHHMPVLLQELVSPPPCCPAEVLPILAAAAEAHQQRSVDEALSLYGQAEEAWRDCLERQQLPAEGDEAGVLPAVGVLFLSVAASSCLLTGGRDQEAWQVLQQCEELLLLPEGLHEAAADAAVWHGAAGVALYHCHNLQAAFEHCVRAYVIRCECGLGPQHPDTAAAGHNLGVVLDCLGKSSRGLQLVEAAHQVFLQELGAGHPRSVVAARNAQAIRHKLLKLLDSDDQPQGLMQQALAAGYPGTISEAAGPAASSARQSPASQQRASRRAEGPVTSAQPQAGSASKGADVAGFGQCSSDPDGSGLSADDSDHQPGGSSSGKASCGRPQGGGMRARLQAVSSRRQQAAPADAAVGSGGGPTHEDPQQQQLARRQQQAVELREYSSLDHLGQGVFRASLQQRELYQALRADINAHSRAASSSRQPGVLEMQVVLPGGAAAAAAAAGQLVQRGALCDSTVAPVEKPLTPAQARRRRLQQGSGGSRRAARLTGSSLVDKVYTSGDANGGV